MLHSNFLICDPHFLTIIMRELTYADIEIDSDILRVLVSLVYTKEQNFDYEYGCVLAKLRYLGHQYNSKPSTCFLKAASSSGITKTLRFEPAFLLYSIPFEIRCNNLFSGRLNLVLAYRHVNRFLEVKT